MGWRSGGGRWGPLLVLLEPNALSALHVTSSSRTPLPSITIPVPASAFVVIGRVSLFLQDILWTIWKQLKIDCGCPDIVYSTYPSHPSRPPAHQPTHAYTWYTCSYLPAYLTFIFTERQTDTDTHSERETETERQRQGETETRTDRQTDRQTERYACIHKSIHTYQRSLFSELTLHYILCIDFDYYEWHLSASCNT